MLQEAAEKLKLELTACKAAQSSLEAAHEVLQVRLAALRTDLAEKDKLLDRAGMEIEQLQQSNDFLTLELKGSQVGLSRAASICWC